MSARKIFFIVHAWVEGEKRMFFDPSIIARNDNEKCKLKKLRWAMAFAGYIFNYGKNGKCVVLVQRTKKPKILERLWK